MAKKTTPATKNEIERFHSWLATEDPLSIATHMYVDADAAFSAALLSVLKPKAQVVFVSADSEIEDPQAWVLTFPTVVEQSKGWMWGVPLACLSWA